MPVKTSLDAKGQWSYTRDPNKPIEEIYKLHIFIGQNDFDKVRDKINALLTQAVADDVFRSFKVINENHRDVIAVKNNKAKSAQLDRYIYGIPYTIYLYDKLSDNNIPKIIEICKQIEGLLKDTSPGNKNVLCTSDIQISPHVYFRQPFILVDGQYVPVSAFGKLAATSRSQGEQSEHCIKIKAGLEKTFKPENNAAAPARLFSHSPPAAEAGAAAASTLAAEKKPPIPGQSGES